MIENTKVAFFFMKKTGFKQRAGFAQKSGFTRISKGVPKNKIKEKKRSHSPFAIQIKKTDTVYSMIVRLRHANDVGIVQCYTCDYRAFWKQNGIECGHYISRGNLGTRWSDINCKPQCHTCNTTLGGNLKVFRERLIQEYGEKVVEELNQEAEKVVRMKVEQIREIRLNLNKILKEIKNQKGL